MQDFGERINPLLIDLTDVTEELQRWKKSCEVLGMTMQV